MNLYGSRLIQGIKRKDSLLYTILLIDLLSLLGWISGKLNLASYSLTYIPIAPASVLILAALTFIFLQRLRSEKPLSFMITLLVLFIALLCMGFILNFLLNGPFDLESVIVKNPGKSGNYVVGRISPISALLFIFLCIGILGINKEKSLRRMEISGVFTLLVFIISLILLIGYLYKSPLLYGSKVIPVSLPLAICFFLFSLTFARTFGSQFWTFNLIKSNKVTHLLFKSFLPLVVVIIILQGFLDTVWSFNDINPPLTGAIILLIVIIITAITVYRVSKVIGEQLLTAERKLKESEEKFRSIMEHSADAIFITNQQGKYIYTNKTASEILGYTPEELANKTFVDLSPVDKVEEYMEIFKLILDHKEKILTEIELLKKDGKFIPTDLNAVLLPDGTIYGSCRNITRRKKAEQDLKDLNKTLSELNADKDRFIAILGHDLKNPFNNLLGLSEILNDDIENLTSEQIKDISLTINATARATYNLLEEILLWARSQQGKIPFNPQPLRIMKIFEEIFDTLNIIALEKGISIRILAPDNMVVFADPDMLKTIMRNLVSNAIKFTGDKGIITIVAEKNSGITTISVSDTGTGIEPQNLSKLFNISEVFTTEGTRGEKGTGLGLLLCRDFVGKHGGEIWVESEAGRGSDFKLTLKVTP